MAVIPDDVAIIVGTATPTDPLLYARWQYWINSALMLIETRLGDTSLLDQSRLDWVVGEAVAAMVKRPDDYTQIEVQVDDGRVARRYETGKGRVVILDEWWNMLSPVSTRGKAFSIDTLPAC